MQSCTTSPFEAFKVLKDLISLPPPPPAIVIVLVAPVPDATTPEPTKFKVVADVEREDPSS